MGEAVTFSIRELRERTTIQPDPESTTRFDPYVIVLVNEWAALLAAVEAAQELADTAEIRMYLGADAVVGGHIGFLTRRLDSKLACFRFDTEEGQ